MTRVTTALKGIVSRLARKIIMGENDWIVQMMLASSVGGQLQHSLEEIENVLPYAMADVTDHLVTKTTLMTQALDCRSRMRLQTRGHSAMAL